MSSSIRQRKNAILSNKLSNNKNKNQTTFLSNASGVSADRFRRLKQPFNFMKVTSISNQRVRKQAAAFAASKQRDRRHGETLHFMMECIEGTTRIYYKVILCETAFTDKVLPGANRIANRWKLRQTPAGVRGSMAWCVELRLSAWTFLEATWSKVNKRLKNPGLPFLTILCLWKLCGNVRGGWISLLRLLNGWNCANCLTRSCPAACSIRRRTR